MPVHNSPPTAARLITLVTACIIVGILYFTQDVLIPIIMAALLAFLLAPVVGWLERHKIPRIPATILTVLGTFSIVVALGYVVGMQIMLLADNMPTYQEEIVRKARVFSQKGGGLTDKLNKLGKEIESAAAPAATTQATQPATKPATSQPLIAQSDSARSEPPQPAPTDAAPGTESNPVYTTVIPPPRSSITALFSYVNLALGPLGTTGVVIVFVFFILLEREDLRDRMIRLVSQGQYTVTTTALDDALGRIFRYMKAQAIINGSYGVTVAIGLWIIGLTLGKDQGFPSCVLWGLIAMMMRYIPYIGPWIAALFPLSIALAVFPGFTVFFVTAAFLITLELLSNNWMEPWLYGSSTGLSTMAILFSAVFWTWLWGPVGLLMSTPLTVCIVVLGKNLPQFNFLFVLLGDAPALAPHERVYQRVLARDEDEAGQVIEEFAKTHTLLETYDQILLPAVAMAEHDRHHGIVEEDKELVVRNALKQLVDDTAELYKLKLTKESTAAMVLPSPVNVLCLPSHDQADEIVGLMLTNILQQQGYNAINISQNALAGEMVGLVKEHKADLVVVSALPPAALSHTRYILRRLQNEFLPERTIAGMWRTKTEANDVKQRLASPLTPIAATLATAVEQITQLSHQTTIAKSA